MIPTLDPRLQLQPAPGRARAWLAALMVGLPIALIGASIAMQQQADAPAALIWAAGAVVLMFVVIDRALRRHRLGIDDGVLDVATTFYRRKLALDELRLDQARVIDLAERTEFKPMLKTNGASLPGFRSGWFRLRNRSRAFVAIADGPRVLWLPTTRGYGLLLQPRQPQALLQHLRELAAAPARG